MKWDTLKRYLWGELEDLTHKQARETGKKTDRFVLIQDGILYYVRRSREQREEKDDDLKLRLVILAPLAEKVMMNFHDLI